MLAKSPQCPDDFMSINSEKQPLFLSARRHIWLFLLGLHTGRADKALPQIGTLERHVRCSPFSHTRRASRLVHRNLTVEIAMPPVRAKRPATAGTNSRRNHLIEIVAAGEIVNQAAAIAATIADGPATTGTESLGAIDIEQ